MLYLAVVAFGVFGPAPARPVAEAGKGARNLGAEVRAIISGDDTPPGTSAYLVGTLTPENVGNILLFVPFGFAFPLRWPRLRWWTVPLGVAASAAIELTQLALLSWRSPSFTDVKWNSIGATLGFALWLASRALRRRHRAGAE